MGETYIVQTRIIYRQTYIQERYIYKGEIHINKQIYGWGYTDEEDIYM